MLTHFQGLRPLRFFDLHPTWSPTLFSNMLFTLFTLSQQHLLAVLLTR